MDRVLEKKKWNAKKVMIISAGAIGILVVIWMLLSATGMKSLRVDAASVRISEVKRASFREYISVSGTVEPLHIFYLDVADGGRILRKFVEEGAVVKAGDALIKLDNPALSLQVMSTQSSFLQAETMTKQTRLTFEQNLLNKQDQLLEVELNLLNQRRLYTNSRALFEKGLISKNEFESASERYETLQKSRALLIEVLKRDSLTLKQLTDVGESNGMMAKNYMALIEEQLANLTVRAPVSGRLTSFTAEIGQSIARGYRLGQIDNIGESKVRATIDEHYIARVAPGQTGDIEFDGKPYKLEIKTVYPQVVNGVFAVEMVFVNEPPKSLRRGQTVRINLQLGAATDALLIENGGFFGTTGGQWIFVLDRDGASAVRRPITIGRQNPMSFEITGGLAAGERVVTSSYESYGDCDKLILK
ncbi:MAG TPA: efflux RND transporter periplasmic adaptor subunit [Bacteroidota bacterium]|nr:efflux RND transporter periplasmic adaptor subunit [Bacteroidota bacterium]